MSPGAAAARTALNGWRGRVVSLLPPPWLFVGTGVRPLTPEENRWRASSESGGLRLRRAGAADALTLPFERLSGAWRRDAI